jgi:hypothetical protein
MSLPLVVTGKRMHECRHVCDSHRCSKHGWVHGGGDTTARKGEGKVASRAQNSPMEDAKRPVVTRGYWKWRSSALCWESRLGGFP